MTIVEITQIPLLNSIVLKQKGGHAFIAAQDSFIIDKEGLLSLLYTLVEIGFVSIKELEWIINENKENSSNTD
jgi:hypothetical protein